MKFDKSKILTCVTADKLKEGQMGWINDYVGHLESDTKNISPYKVFSTDKDTTDFPFTAYGRGVRRYFYPAPEPSYRPFADDELNDLVGKVLIQKHTGNAMLIIKVVDSETGKVVSLGGSQKRNAQQLLDGWTHKNGEPCGVREDI